MIKNESTQVRGEEYLKTLLAQKAKQEAEFRQATQIISDLESFMIEARKKLEITRRKLMGTTRLVNQEKARVYFLKMEACHA
ncbi:MAG: hypothetical protein AB7U05_08540 [Mangrovibacterium sp.]